MGPRRSFICRMRLGNVQPEALGSSTHLHRVRQRNALGPSIDGHNYAVVHSTGYVKNWPPTSTFFSFTATPVTCTVFETPHGSRSLIFFFLLWSQLEVTEDQETTTRIPTVALLPLGVCRSLRRRTRTILSALLPPMVSILATCFSLIGGDVIFLTKNWLLCYAKT